MDQEQSTSQQPTSEEYAKRYAELSSRFGELATELESNGSELSFYERNYGDEEAELISLFLRKNSSEKKKKKLIKLDLNSNKIGTVGAKHIFSSLSENHHLQTLFLGWNHIGGESLEELSSSLAVNSVLNLLSLRCNNVGEGVPHLLDGLLSNDSLTELNLAQTNVGDAGALALCKALNNGNSTLTALHLNNNNIGQEGGEEFLRVVQTSKTLTYLELAGNKSLPSKLVDQIEEVIYAAEFNYRPT